MYAVIESGGKQYRVVEGGNIKVEKILSNIGEEVKLNKVLAVANNDGHLLVGDSLKNASVLAEVVNQGKGEKITMYKFKRRKHYKRKIGHRQLYTELRIKSIET